jgi:hypothetical protein
MGNNSVSGAIYRATKAISRAASDMRASEDCRAIAAEVRAETYNRGALALWLSGTNNHPFNRGKGPTARAASDMRSKGHTNQLVGILNSTEALDADDRDLLATFIEGLLGPRNGVRRASIPHWRKREAENAAREHKAKHGGNLLNACEAVAPRFGMQPGTLHTYIRRSAKAK